MKHRSSAVGFALGLAAFLLAGCSTPPAEAPAAPAAVMPAVHSPVSINAEMVRLVDHAAHQLWAVEKEGMAPKTDADWENVEEHATQIAAAGALVTMGGTGPNDLVWIESPGWKTSAKAMSDAGMAALKATESKNMEALVAANGQLVEACEACHKEFKPDLPSEGIVHVHEH